MIARAWHAASRATVPAAGAAVLARAGLAAVWLLLGAVAIAAAAWCWTVTSDRRARNAAVLLAASRGRLPHPVAVAAAGAPVLRRRWWRKNRRERAGRG